MRRAASRAACTAGNRRATKIPMIAMTTRSSTSVNPNLFPDERLIADLPITKEK
jgi:hypothetical protein